MRWHVLILMSLIELEARSNHTRMRELMSRIQGLMSPLKRRMHGLRTFSPPDNGKCGLSEELRFCRPMCEPSCAELHPSCAATCSLAVCMCQRGFVRQSGMCIPMSACKFFDLEPIPKKGIDFLAKAKVSISSSSRTLPSKTSDTAVLNRPLRPPPNCGQGQQFTRCVCDATCTESKTCHSCSSGCGCFLHHVRNDEGICVLFRDCPLPRPSKKPTATVVFSSTSKRAVTSPHHGGETTGSTKSIAKVQPLARGVKTDTKSVRKLGGIKKSRQLSVSKRIRQKFGSKKTKEVAKTDKGSKGPIPPVSAQHVSKTKTAQSQKSKKASKDGKTGPLPPSAAPHKLKSKKRGPPAARPLHFGPPGITPVVFFRTRRIARKERVLKHLKLRTKRRRVL